MNQLYYCILSSFFFISSALSGQVIIAQWNFNSITADSDPTTGNLNPSTGIGGLSPIGGTSSNFSDASVNNGSSDPASGDNSALNLTDFPSQSNNNLTAGIEFGVSTYSYKDIVIKWDQHWDNNASKFIRFQYSTDGGANWVNYTDGGDTSNGLYMSVQGANRWHQEIVADLSNINGVKDNSDFRFRILTSFAPDTNIYVPVNSSSGYTSNSNISIDMISVSGNMNLGTFNLSTPPDQLFLQTKSGINFPVLFRWYKSRNANGYDLLMDNKNGDFSNPVFQANVSINESDTVLYTTIGEIDSILNILGVMKGDTFESIWTIQSFSSFDTILSDNQWRLTYFRDIPLTPFSLISPVDNASILAESGNINPFIMSWNSSENATKYEILFDNQGGDFSNPVYLLLSDNSGADTFLSLTLSDLDFHLSQMGIQMGDSTQLIWKVIASNKIYEIPSNQEFGAKFIRKDVAAGPFDLIYPVSLFELVTERMNETDSFTFRWRKADKATNYVVVMDLPGGDIKNSPAQLLSHNNPSDTFLTVSLGELDMMFEGGIFNIFMGDSIELEWGVVAWNQGAQTLSNQTRQLTIIRKIILGEFDLINPVDLSRFPIVKEDEIELLFEWSISENAVYYEFQLDTESGDFSSPIVSLVSDFNGTANQISIKYSFLDSLIAETGVGNGDSVKLIWTVKSIYRDVIKYANQTNNIKFIRVVQPGNFNLLSPEDQERLMVTNTGGAVAFTWTKSDKSTLYEVLFDSTGGDFSNPLLVLPSANNGKELFLSVPKLSLYNLIDIAAGVKSDSVEVKWTVKAGVSTMENIERSVWVDTDRNNHANKGIKFDGFQSQEFNAGICKDGLVLTIFHPKSLELMLHPNHEPDCPQGKLWPPYVTYKYQAYYTFDTKIKSERDRFVNLINDLESGTYVALFSRYDAGFSQWEQEIYDAFKTLGCSDIIGLSDNQAAYAMIGKKGDVEGTATENIVLNGYASVDGKMVSLLREPFILASNTNLLYLVKDPNASISDISTLNSGFSIFPNPAKDKVHIKQTKSGVINYEIRDLHGRIVTFGTFENSVTIDMTLLSSGVYLIHLQGQDVRFSSKIIKQE